MKLLHSPQRHASLHTTVKKCWWTPPTFQNGKMLVSFGERQAFRGFVCRRPFNNVINDKRHLSSTIKASTRSKNSVPTSFPGSSPSIWERGGTCLRNLLTPTDALDRRSFVALNRINVSERVSTRLMFSK